MNKPLISVIVPVYRVEPYLDKCIESIVNQTYSNLEILLVDDGSPDNCPAMCDSWAERDARIRVIHQENRGAGEARNLALSLATGEFISFIDGDDIVAEDFYAHLLSLMSEEIDVVECEYICFEREPVLINKAQNCIYRVFDPLTALDEHINNRLFKQVIWNKLYRKQVIGSVRFPTGKKIDDEFFTYRVLGNARKLIHMNAVKYAYRQQSKSVMHELKPNRLIEATEAKTVRLRYVQEEYPELVATAQKSLWFSCLYCYQVMQRCGVGNCATEMRKIKDTLTEFPVNRVLLRESNVKERAWLCLESMSIGITSAIRNAMRIGV